MSSEVLPTNLKNKENGDSANVSHFPILLWSLQLRITCPEVFLFLLTVLYVTSSSACVKGTNHVRVMQQTYVTMFVQIVKWDIFKCCFFRKIKIGGITIIVTLCDHMPAQLSLDRYCNLCKFFYLIDILDHHLQCYGVVLQNVCTTVTINSLKTSHFNSPPTAAV